MLGFLKGWLGYGPKSSPPTTFGPSSAAVAAATDYYQGLYHDRAPDPAEFSRLLAIHGAPDWPNPYPLGEPEHYLLHPDGFLFADLEAILVDMMSERAQNLLPLVDEEHPLPAVAQASLERIRSQEGFLHQCADQARHCWALLLAGGHPLPRLASIVHPDNLWLVNMDILSRAMEGQWPDVDPALVAQGMRQFPLAG